MASAAGLTAVGSGGSGGVGSGGSGVTGGGILAALSGSSGTQCTLSMRHLFGCKGDVKDNIQYLDENRVLYCAGYNIIEYNAEKKTQKFLQLSATFNNQQDVKAISGQITAICLSPYTGGKRSAATAGADSKDSKDGYSGGKQARILAVAERGSDSNPRAQISLFDLSTGKRRGKPLISAEMTSRSVVSLAFSPDGKFLLAQGGAPDWILINWNWEKARVVQSAKVTNNASAYHHITSPDPNPIRSDPIAI